jgi:hypothetical protein
MSRFGFPLCLVAAHYLNARSTEPAEKPEQSSEATDAGGKTREGPLHRVLIGGGAG